MRHGQLETRTWDRNHQALKAPDLRLTLSSSPALLRGLRVSGFREAGAFFMPKFRAPYFKFWYADFLLDEVVQRMSNEIVGVYLRLLCACWHEGSIPDCPQTLIQMYARDYRDTDEDYDAFSGQVKWLLENCFEPCPGKPNRLTNKRLATERADMEHQAEVNRKNALSGRTQFAKRSHNDRPPNQNQNQKQNQNTFVKRRGRPTKGQAATYFEELGNSGEAERFFDHYESNNWRVGKNPMKDWRAAARNWLRNAHRFSQESKTERRRKKLMDELGEIKKHEHTNLRADDGAADRGFSKGGDELPDLL